MLLAVQGPLPWAVIALAAGFLFGALLLWLLRRQDHFSWVLARAPALPIRVLAGGDDAWLRGTVRCAAPLLCPWFEVPCVSYSYQIERQVTHTHTDKDGKVHTRTEWQTEHREARSTDFELDDGDCIAVRVERSRNEALQGLDTDYETGRRRHSAQVLELGAEVSVLGVKQDDGSFAAEREVPCLITRQPRLQRVHKSEGSETWLFVGACALPFLGGALAMWLWLAAPLQQQPLYWLLLPLGGLVAMLPYWWIGTFNRLVRLRQQVSAAFRQTDVDLAVRAQLVPNLLRVVEQSAGHERQLLAQLAAIRSSHDQHTAVAGEAQAVAATRQVLALHESRPELRADAIYRDLHERLWAVEEKLMHTRSLYNDVVTEWNDRIASFPAMLVARACGYRQAPQFAGDDAELPPPLCDRDRP